MSGSVAEEGGSYIAACLIPLVIAISIVFWNSIVL